MTQLKSLDIEASEGLRDLALEFAKDCEANGDKDGWAKWYANALMHGMNAAGKRAVYQKQNFGPELL